MRAPRAESLVTMVRTPWFSTFSRTRFDPPRLLILSETMGAPHAEPLDFFNSSTFVETEEAENTDDFDFFDFSGDYGGPACGVVDFHVSVRGQFIRSGGSKYSKTWRVAGVQIKLAYK